MNAVHVLENKIQLVEKYLLGLKKYDQYSKEEIEKDEIKRLALERDLYLLVQSTIDLAEAVISYCKLPKPTAYKENFQLLRAANLIDQNLFHSLCQMIGFRNLIAHEYVDLDYNRLYEVLKKDSKDIKDFIKQLKENLKL